MPRDQSDPVPGLSVDELIGEVRERREHLQGLIARLKDDRDVWQRAMSVLIQRAHLTPSQRRRLQKHLAALERRHPR